MLNYNVEEANKMIISILFSQPKKKNRLNAEQLAFLEQYGIRTNLGAMKGGTRKYSRFKLYTLNSLATVERFADHFSISLSKDDVGRRGSEEELIYSTDCLVNTDHEWWKASYKYCSQVYNKQVGITEQLELKVPVDLLGFLLNERFVWFSYMPSTLDALGEETRIFKYALIRLNQSKKWLAQYENHEYEDEEDELFAESRMEDLSKDLALYTEFVEKVMKREASYDSFRKVMTEYRLGLYVTDWGK